MNEYYYNDLGDTVDILDNTDKVVSYRPTIEEAKELIYCLSCMF
jgi:hypothetical protein